MTEPDLYAVGRALWDRWTLMWNRDPSLARTLVADPFVLHLPLPDPIPQRTVSTPAAVETWVTSHRARYRALVFHADMPPFVDVVAGVIAGPWHADASVDGAPRPVCGIDLLAFRDGKITEYWTLSRPVDAVGDWVTAGAPQLARR